jgi:ATP-dependent RNA helicase DeaD
MLDMGFQEDLNEILRTVPDTSQTVLFSATIPKGIMQIAGDYQRDARHVVIRQDTLTVKTVRQFYTTVRGGAKKGELLALLQKTDHALCLVFVNTKRMADVVCEDLKQQNLRADVLHGDISQQKRERIMNAFRAGKLDILVATDVAARGIDVRNIDLVVNFDLPMDSESYVHRIGRTGRANRTGTAHTLIYRQETGKLNAIMRDTKTVIMRQTALEAAV